jgi:hypothetical protein
MTDDEERFDYSQVSDDDRAELERFASVIRLGAGQLDQTAPRPPEVLRELLLAARAGQTRDRQAREAQAREEKQSFEHVKRVAEVIKQERAKLRERQRKATRRHDKTGSGPLTIASEITEQNDLTRGARLIAWYRRDAQKGPSDVLDPTDVVNWLFGQKPFIEPVTWRGYRIDMTRWLGQHKPPGYVRAIGMLEAEPQWGRCGNQHVYRSPHAHFQALQQRLSDLQTRDASWLRDWLVAGVHTGLSPVEWRMATLVRRGEEIWLDVNTVSSRDEPIVCRSLGISGLQAETRAAIERMVERGRDVGKPGTWYTRQSRLATMLRDTCKGGEPRMQPGYTLNSLRDQFVANVLSVRAPDEAAALVGEVCAPEQARGYARARIAWTGSEIDVPKPDPELLANMRRRLDWYNRRREAESYRPLRGRAGNRRDRGRRSAD